MWRFSRRSASQDRGPEGEQQPEGPDLTELKRLLAATDTKMREAAAHYLDRKSMLRPSDAHLANCNELLSFLEPQHITHEQLRRVERAGLNLARGASFRRNMIEQSEARKLGVLRPGWLLDNKSRAYDFVDAVGVRRPSSSGTTHAFDDIDPKPATLVKPTRATGSRGVYAIRELDQIQHLRDGRQFDSWNQVASHANRLMSPKKARPLPDRWLVEELIVEEDGRFAGDLKYYCFFGEVLFVQESRRDAGLRVAFWTRDGLPLRTGRYEDVPLDDAIGSTEEQLAVVSSLSRRIPVPFMRIDMLRSSDGLVFGEFTPRPGHFDEFNDHLDRQMGEAWIRAEAAIVEAVLAGDTFPEFATLFQGRGK